MLTTNADGLWCVLCCSHQPRFTHSAVNAGGTSSTPLLHFQQNLFFLGITNFSSAYRGLRLKTRRFSGDVQKSLA